VIASVERDAEAGTPFDDATRREAAGHVSLDRLEVVRVAFVAAAATAVWLHLWEPFAHFSLIGILATAIGGYPIFRESFENLLQRRMTMELSMTIALVAALSIGQAFTALVITGFVLVAEILEHLTVARGREAIGDLVRYLPRTAIVRRAGTIREVPAGELVTGDAVLVNPGALVPIDGLVIAGASFVDESRITGESMPAEKVPGARAFAGTVNLGGALEIRTERVGRDTSFGRIIDAIESAERSRAPVERLADRLSGYLVYFALGAALVTYLLTRNVVATISVIIVAGACGIAAGTPLAVLGAVGRAARAGAIVKGGRYLEALAAVDTVIFDKTGTVTFGRPDVRRVSPAPGISADRLLAAAAAAERRSEHPIGTAIVAYAEAHECAVVEPQTFVYTPGRGIRASVDGATVLVGSGAFLRDAGAAASDAADEAATEIHVAARATYLGSIAVADALRPEAVAAVAALKAMSIRTVLLTGDVARVATAAGRELGIDAVAAELLPEEKSAYVGALVDAGKIVAMVGDGVNDAPALARATVGVAMGSGTDVARESADVVLLGNDLLRFVETVRIARRTKGVVMQNFAGTIAVDAVGILLAALGFLTPLVAAFIHVASELTFILNSTRMLAPAAGQRPNRRLTSTSRAK
jgi:Cd2+/Zn2+-exporting ATPase/Cu+-exporting ATPase